MPNYCATGHCRGCELNWQGLMADWQLAKVQLQLGHQDSATRRQDEEQGLSPQQQQPSTGWATLLQAPVHWPEEEPEREPERSSSLEEALRCRLAVVGQELRTW